MRLFSVSIFLAAVAYAQSSTPAITSVTPNAIDAGGPEITLTVNVTAFVPGAVVKWSDTPLTSSYVNDTTLTVTVPANLTAICGKYSLTITNGQTQAVSNAYPVIVKPFLKSISPNLLPAGSGGTTVTANGLGFSSNVYLTLTAGSQTRLATTYSGTTTLSAFVPASALNGTYPVSLFVTDPTTGAVSQTLPITLTRATVSVISPARIQAGIPTFTLNVGGANFVFGATVLFDGAPLTTRVFDSTFVQATVPAGLVHDAVPGGVGIQVRNPGADPSNTIKLVIDANPFGTQIISLSPDKALAGSPPVTLTVTGERFVPGSTVLWVDFRTPLATTFVSDTQLIATIPATLVAIEGTAPITVSTPGIALSNTVTFPIVAASPTIANNGISPASAIAGGPAFTLTVSGDGFIPASQVNGLAGSTTTYVSQTQLNVNVPASAIAAVGSHVIQVVNPGPRPSPQAPLFTVKAPTPAITSLSPASVVTGGPDFTLTVNGSNFFPNASVTWNGGALPTTRLSATQVTALVSAALIASSGAAKVTVVNEGPVSSNELVFSVSSTPTASLTSLNPSSALPGGNDFTLTVAGAGFAANSTVRWNGAPLVTTFIGATQLTARVPAALIATAGTASVSVATDGGISNALPFTIAPLTPVTSTAGIVNAASSLPAIAPGTLIAVYGSNLAAVTLEAAGTPLPVSLGGTSVSINGAPIPLLFVSPGQVNAQVPYEAKVGTAKLSVTSNGVASPAVNFDVAATGPGVFTPQQSNHVLALNLADGNLNAPQTPARPGQYVTAYLTGQGAVDRPELAPTGDVAPSNPPFPVPVANVQVKIGGRLADLQYAGLAPGFIGLLQMNVLIPDVPPGELSFDVSVGGVSAAPTVISIASKQ